MNPQYMQYPSQKPVTGPPLPQNSYFENNVQGQLPNAQHDPHSNSPLHPPLSQNNLVNQMSNISLGHAQKSPLEQNFPHPPDKKNSISPSSINGFNTLTENVPQGTEVESGDLTMSKSMPQNPDLQHSMHERQRPPNSQSLPFAGQSTNLTQQYSRQQQQYHGQIQMRKPPDSPSFPEQNNIPGNQSQYPLSQKNIHGPPLPGQQYPMTPTSQTLLSEPASQLQNSPNTPVSPLMMGQQSYPGQSLPSSSIPEQNYPGPPLPGQNSAASGTNLPGPSISNQRNISAPSSQLPLSNQQNFSTPSMSNQENFPTISRKSNFPTLSATRQQNFPVAGSGQQNILTPGQQNFPVPPSSLPQQNFSASSVPGQKNLSAPPGNTPNFPAPGPQHFPGHYPPPTHNLSAPPQNLPGPPSLSNQSNIQPHLSSPQFPVMSGQKPYIPGQAATNPGINRPGVPPQGYQQGYPQQGYQNPADVYGNQRNLYQGGIPNAYPQGIQQQQQQQQQQAKRLDPDHMPSPIQVIQDDQRTRGGVFITNQKGLVPPLVTTKFTVQDQGNSSPRYIRSTMYTVPTTTDIMKQTSVPFGLILSPMARIEDGEYEPPIVDMGEIGPVRCIRCKAYMSPFMQFIDSGRRFQCMFCKATTEVPAEYFQHLDHTGQRMDRFERPELMLGTYEYIATKDYCPENKFPKPPAVIFLIDVSYNTVKSGLVNLICAEMKNIIRNLPIDVGQIRTNMKIGFITYNNTVHFYNIKACLAQPQMMVVGDVQDVFMPLLDGFLCDAEESEAVIDSLMIQIPTMFAETRETETILAPAMQAGLEALKASECVGKLMVFHSSLPIAEAPGKLKNRDDRKLLGTEKEKTILTPQNNVYNNLGQECVAAGCSVDLFILNNSYIDLATIGQVCRLTGGKIYKYTYFQADVDGERLITDVINNISKPIAFNAVMRVRTSTGVRPTDFYGHFYMSNTTDMELASIDCDKAVAVEVKHDDKLAEEEGVYVQVALLYTSCGGIRRLRIFNLSLKSSSQMAELYRACDLDAIINFFSKQSVFKLLEHSPKTVKENLISRCAIMLAAYRKNCAAPSSAGQLILPECMKLLPLYVNCLLKSDAISGGSDMTIDDRSYVMQAVAIMPVYTSVNYFYPRLLPLHTVDPQDTKLPQMMRCSIDKVTEDGAFLLENGIHMFLWLGLGLNPQWVQAVFGVQSTVQIDTDRPRLPVLDTPLNKRIHEIINTVRAERYHCMRLTVLKQRDKLEMVFRHFLVEDKGTDGSASYVDFLCHMHKEIRALLS